MRGDQAHAAGVSTDNRRLGQVSVGLSAASKLDRAMEHLADGIELYLDSPTPLPQIREALAAAPAGRAQVRLIPWLGGSREAEILFPQPRRLSAALVAQLRAVPGVRDLREV